MPDLVNLNISTLSYFGIQRGDVLQWDMNIQSRFQEGIKSSRTLNIMITGKMDSGKTALINGLFGRKVGAEAREDWSFRGAFTTHVEAYEFYCTDAKIWDTPGLQDGTDEDRYLDEMKKCCSNCNLYMYCIRMTERRLESSNIRAMEKLTNTFGKDWLKKVLFVLTFANFERAYCPRWCDLREYFEGRVKLWHEALARKLVALGVEQEIAEKIVVVPTGYYEPLPRNSDPWVLPGISNWLQNFWYKCAEVIDDRGFPAFVHVVSNSHRLSVKDHITAAGLAKAGAAASSRKNISISSVTPSLADVATGDAIGNVYIDPTTISLYWKYSNRFPFATGEL